MYKTSFTVTGGDIVRSEEGPEEAGKSRLRAKKRAGKWTAAYIKRRIQNKGLGAGGSPLKGYSTRPLTVSRGILKKRIPPGGFPKYYKGGYAAYREEVGLQTDHFAFTNTGASFNRFVSDVADPAAGTPIIVGFTNSKSHQAAMIAVENDRPDMFGLDKRELDKVRDVYLDSVVASVWKGIFQPEASNQSEPQSVEE